MTKFSFYSSSGYRSMDFKIFVTLAVLGLVFREALAASSTSESSPTSTPVPTTTTPNETSPSGVTGGTTAAPGGATAALGGQTLAPGGQTTAAGGQTLAPGGQTSTPAGQTAAPGGQTTAPGGQTAAPGGQTPAPNQLKCKVGVCNGTAAHCLNTTTTTVKLVQICDPGNKCALVQKESTYVFSCEADCKSLTSQGKVACCSTENCTPDLSKPVDSGESGADAATPLTIILFISVVLMSVFVM